jgi:hypothetical protein
VVDEPFYAFYLQATGKKHPLAAEIIVAGEINWREVAARLTSAKEDGSRIIYQKQMTHHLLREVERGWLSKLTNCFLIRDPAEVIASYLKKNGEPTLDDLGFVQQTELFDWVRAQSRVIPPIVDARDVLRNPERTLRLLCSAVGVDFDCSMLSWPPGLRASDGIWAKHWYGEVARSTSFQPPPTKIPTVPRRLREIHERCQECYDHLFPNRLC